MEKIFLVFRTLYPHIPDKYTADFAYGKFYKNNLRILLLSIFLFFEQLCYAFFVSKPGSGLQQVYYLSAIVMLMFFVSGFYLLKKNKKKSYNINLFHEFYEVSFGFFGMAIACLRFLIVEFDATIFRIPTVYIAVLYGTAVIYAYRPWQSIFLYVTTSAAAIILMPFFHPEIISSSYIADICSNGIIALMISVINFRNFIINFRNKKLIEEQNNDLLNKNLQIQNINIELKEKSERDELTGLFNRRKLNEVMYDIFKKVERYDQKFSLIIMDVDHFKHINDTYGHDCGDIVLKEIAGILKMNIRDIDICGRWGGEEFLVLCPGIDIDGARNLAERLRIKISCYSFYGKQQISGSFGVSTYSSSHNITSLIKSADTNLYAAKRKGRNMVVADSAGLAV